MFRKHYICWLHFLALVFSCDGSINPGRTFKYGKLGVPIIRPTNKIYVENWFTQLLDHFQPTDTRTWRQRYFVVKDHYKEGGPVFLFIGGENEAYPSRLEDFAVADYAVKYNALMFMLEHRYYGKSRPTSDLSVENLKYLSSEQALADLAYFTVAMNSQHKLPPNTKWVAFGGSYAGNLAAWVRLKYPHLIHASVSSSGPVLAKVDFTEFLDVVRDSIATHSSQCVEAIQAANKQINTLLKTPDGRKTIEEEFRLCDPIDSKNHKDIVSLLLQFELPVGNTVQYDGESLKYSIDDLCDTMVNQSLGTPVKRFADFSNGNIGSCLDYKYDRFIKGMRNITWDAGSSGLLVGRQWFYQVCTEFGYLQSSESKKALFGEDIPVDFLIQRCSDVFGKEFTKELLYRAVDRSNTIYGGLDLQATRIVYVHGSIDPWHTLGITKTRIPQSPAIFINGTSHCANMLTPSPFDPPALKAAREEISALIGKWLQEP